MAEIAKDDLLTALNGREGLFTLLKERLDWPLDPEDPFTYDEPDSVLGRAKASVSLSRLVDFTANDPFVIFLVEFRAGFQRGHLREVLRGVRKRIREEAAYRTADLDELVFVCTLPGKKGKYSGLRFVHFEERENRQPRLRVFGYDSDTIDETYTLRTANLPALKLTYNVLDEVDWASCKKSWSEAWSVEKVTREFFKDYKRVFEMVRDTYISGVKGDKQLFTQRLFNRLMFIHFLSKKRWLRFDGRTDYLFALRDAARAKNENLFHDRLFWTFFNGLGVFVAPEHHNADFLVEKRGEVPYLNGGLFEMVDEDDVRDAVKIDNAAFDKIFNELFLCYNFTISESTPDDQEVAVDPEMLGKVFEELVTGRHESGSYYTPRPVVAFMCREALKGYLADCGEGIERLVDFHDADAVSDSESVLAAIKRVRVVDPACGSGAYLLGMLQELMAVRQALFASKKVDAKTLYERKLEIIQTSLYGVDLDLFAVNTARLRLWLSLVVDDSRNPLTDPKADVALPNLDFKIEQGDSLTAPDPQGVGGTLNADAYAIEGRILRKLYLEHFTPNKDGRAKQDIRADIAKHRDAIAKLFGDDIVTGAFDWRVRCVHLFVPEESITDLGGALNLGGTLAPIPEPGGFDIVLANPPYVRADAQFKHLKPDEVARQARIAEWKKYRESLKKSGIYKTLHEKWDLYIPFLERAHQILASRGQMVFIIPDAFNANKYAQKSREMFLQQSCVERIDFCTDILPPSKSRPAIRLLIHWL